jgi:hypothetical protein
MSVESVSNIGDLNPAYPTGAEKKSEGDDHIRNIKKGLTQSFAGFTGAILVTGTDGGAANAYTLTPANALTAYGTKMLAVFCPTASNTGASTLNISGLGAKAIVSVSGVALAAGDLTAGRYYTAFYDGTQFRLDNVTQNYVDQIVISGTVPGVNDPANTGKVFSSTGTTGQWIPLDGRGSPITALGNSGTGTVTATYSSAAEGWTLTSTGAFTLTTAGWPSGRLAGGLLKLTNGGAYSLTTTGITWIKSDGTETTTFSASGITLKSAGVDRIALFSFGDGTVYGKVV